MCFLYISLCHSITIIIITTTIITITIITISAGQARRPIIVVFVVVCIVTCSLLLQCVRSPSKQIGNVGAT